MKRVLIPGMLLLTNCGLLKKKRKIFKFYIWVEAVNNVVIVSGELQGTQPFIYMYPFSPRLPSHPGHNMTLSRVPCAV